MRINEEIDALESMGIQPIEYLVSTRIVARHDRDHSRCTRSRKSFPASRFVTVVLFRQSAGLYKPTFNTFLNPIDLVVPASPS